MASRKQPRMDAFTRAYFETALWSSTDESRDDGGDPLDANYGIEDIDPATRDRMIEDCADFQKDFGDLIEADTGDWERAGHDFWLTRNGHGAGFWDGDWPKHGDELTEASKDFGEYHLYVGDDGVIYGDTSGGYRYNPGYDPKTRKAPSTQERRPPRHPAVPNWTVESGRMIHFEGQPYFHIAKEAEALPVEADSLTHFVVECLNREGLTPDDLYERHMGFKPRRSRR